MARTATALVALFALLLGVSLLIDMPRVGASDLVLQQATPTDEHSDEHDGEHADEHTDEHDAEHRDEHEDEHADEHSHGERIDPGDASIRIVSPSDGFTTQDDSVTIRIETTNFELGEGRHWHLFVDGAEHAMSQGSSTTLIARELEPGAHTIEVVPSNERHENLDVSDTIVVIVEQASEPAEPVPELVTEAPPAATPASDNTLLIAGVVAAVLVVAGVGFAVARRRYRP